MCSGDRWGRRRLCSKAVLLLLMIEGEQTLMRFASVLSQASALH